MKAKRNQIESPLTWLYDRKISSWCPPPPLFMNKVHVSGQIWRFLARSVHQKCLTHFLMLQAVCRPYVYRNRTSNDEGLICVLTYYVGKALQKNISDLIALCPVLGKMKLGYKSFYWNLSSWSVEHWNSISQMAMSISGPGYSWNAFCSWHDDQVNLTQHLCIDWQILQIFRP